jgi:hypothetical protein
MRRRTTPRPVLVKWPWRDVDPVSANSWDGTVALPRDPTPTTGVIRRGGWDTSYTPNGEDSIDVAIFGGGGG